MPRFSAYEPITVRELEAERLHKLEGIQALTNPRYFSEGSPSFVRPSSNALSNLRDKLGRQSLDLGDGLGFALNSGAGLIARGELPDVTTNIPIYSNDEKNVLLTDGTMKNVQDLKGPEFFDAIDPTARTILETNGVSREQFHDIDNMADATERYQNIVRGVELDGRIRRYNEVNPHYATATGVLGFALEVVTDPITIATLGSGVGLSGVKSLGTKGTKMSLTALKTATKKSIAEEGFSTAATRLGKTIFEKQTAILPEITRNTIENNAIARHMLATTIGGGTIFSFDALAQVSEYERRVEDLGIQEEFGYSYARGGISVLLGAFLGNLGASFRGSRPKPLTTGDVAQMSPTSLVGRRAANKVRSGTAAADTHADLAEMTILGQVEHWAEYAYSRAGSTKIGNILENALIVNRRDTPGTPTAAQGKVTAGVVYNKETGNIYSLEELGEFFAKGPSEEEALEALATGNFKEPKASVYNRELRELTDQLDDLITPTIRRGTGGVPDAVRKEIKKVQRKLAKLKKERDAFVSTGFQFSPGERQAASLRSVVSDTKVTTAHTSEVEGVTRMSDLLGFNVDEDVVAPPAHPQDKSATVRFFKWLQKAGGLGTLGNTAQSLEKLADQPIARMLAKMYSAFDPRIGNDNFADANGYSIITVAENIMRVSLLKRDYYKASRKVLRGKSAEERARIGAEVAQLRTGTKKPAQVSQEARDLLPSVEHFYEAMGDLGQAGGVLRNRIDKYMNVNLIDTIDDVKILEVAQLYRQHLYDTVLRATKDGQVPLHKGTLVRLKITDSKGKPLDKVHVENDVHAFTYLDELTVDEQSLYLERLDDSLLREGEHVINTRLGRNDSVASDPLARDITTPAYFREDNRASRRVQQEFWYSDGVLKLGVLDTELDHVLGSYERSFGGTVALQLTMREILGEVGRFEDFVTVLSREINHANATDAEKGIMMRALEDLKEMKTRTLHHSEKVPSGFEEVIQPLVDLVSATIQQSVIVAMQTEVSIVILKDLFHKDDISELMNSIRKTFDRDQIRTDAEDAALAYEYHRDDSRFVGESSFDPTNPIGRVARWWRDKSRLWLGEAALTRRLKVHYYTATYNRAGRNLLKKIDKLAYLDRAFDASDPKAFTQAVRDAGLGGDVGFAKEVRRLGLHTKKARAALQRFKEGDPKSLRTRNDAQKFALAEANVDIQQDMLDVADALHRFAFNDTERVIVTRSAGTQLRSDNVLANVLLQFLTYPTAWFNGFLKYGTQNSNKYLAGYMVTYMIGETFASVGRDVASGKDLDEVLDDWEKNFVQKAAATTTRMPLMGAFSDLLFAPVLHATGGRGRVGFSSNPAFSFPEKAMQETFGNISKMANNEDIEPADMKHTFRMIPFMGTPAARYLTNN